MILTNWLIKPPTHPLRPVIPNNAWGLCITAAAGTEFAASSSCNTIKLLTALLLHDRSLKSEDCILHAASLHQGFPHCERFSTAATRRCLDRVSVPVWLAILSDQLPVVALVSFYLTN